MIKPFAVGTILRYNPTHVTTPTIHVIKILSMSKKYGSFEYETETIKSAYPDCDAGDIRERSHLSLVANYDVVKTDCFEEEEML
ncbi:MAG: hypothetical protein WCT16_05115 [Candidatus Buchananbacteria bacterium]